MVYNKSYDLDKILFPPDRISQVYSKSKGDISRNIALNKSYHTRYNAKYVLNGLISARTICTTNINFQNTSEAAEKQISEGNESGQQINSNENTSVIETTNVNESSVEKSVSASEDNSIAEKSESSENVILSNTEPSVEDSNELILDFLPDRPTPVDGDSSSLLLGMDPPLESLGLASWWPSGRLQYFMEFLHNSSGLDLQWWQAIVLTTVIVRMCVFPFVVIAQKNVARLNNNMPQMQQLQEKMTDARRRGDMYDSAVLGAEMQKFMKEKNVNPVKNILPIMCQFPIFASMFIGLRGMANLPLESMMSGGMLWFNDLTIPDPYYALPILTATSLYIQIKVGADGMSAQGMGPLMKHGMKLLPFGLLILTVKFPAAITFYWFTTNIISVAQAKIIRIEGLRKVLGIPKMIVWDQNKLPVKEKGMKESFRETMDNWKVQGEVMDRRSVDATAFRDAGSRKPKKTFKHDPTKPKARLH